MVIELTCQACGAAFVPTREDVLKGPGWYRRCPSCRTPPIARLATTSLTHVCSLAWQSKRRAS
jgi:hypothetical protein